MLSDQAHSGPPIDPSAQPTEVILGAGGAGLTLHYESGERLALSAEALRFACRCAWCTRSRVDGSFPPSFQEISIQRIEPFGGYALNFLFSDGHDRGIFPFVYLQKLAAEPAPQPMPERHIHER